MYQFTDEEIDFICKYATDRAEALSRKLKGGIMIQDMHNIVEGALVDIETFEGKVLCDLVPARYLFPMDVMEQLHKEK